MRLVDLAPRWVLPAQWASPAIVFYIGMTFLCPHCRKTRLAVEFHNPVDPGGIAETIRWPWPSNGLRWRRDGDNFDEMTITPSIGADVSGHAHVSILRGEVVFA